MANILNFRNWVRMNEDATSLQSGDNPADLAALDRIQQVADRGPRMSRGLTGSVSTDKPAETLITKVGATAGEATTMGLQTGQPYKIMNFNATYDSNDPSQTVKIRAIFFAKDGVLNATLYRNGVLAQSGPVNIYNNPGGFSEIIGVGDWTTEPSVKENGVGGDAEGFAAPISSDIAGLFPANKNGLSLNSTKVPRGGSNVLWSKDNALLKAFVAAERAKAPITPTQKP